MSCADSSMIKMRVWSCKRGCGQAKISARASCTPLHFKKVIYTPVHSDMYKATPEMRTPRSLIRTLSAVPKVSVMERLHCTSSHKGQGELVDCNYKARKDAWR